MFRSGPLLLHPAGLAQVVATVKAHQFGLVLIASWQAVVRGLVRDENDNAGAVLVVENVKAAARESGIPWLIDAHSGKGEDQQEDADPSKAMRGASAAAAGRGLHVVVALREWGVRDAPAVERQGALRELRAAHVGLRRRVRHR